MIDQIINNLNLVELLLIPILTYLGKSVKDLIESYIAQRRTEAAGEAYKQAWYYVSNVVQSCFVQIIEPAWKEFKAKPDDANIKARYQNALKLAKARATDQMKTHLTKLPSFISELLVDKIDDMIESVIPVIKAQNKNPSLARSNRTV